MRAPRSEFLMCEIVSWVDFRIGRWTFVIYGREKLKIEFRSEPRVFVCASLRVEFYGRAGNPHKMFYRVMTNFCLEIFQYTSSYTFHK